MKITFLLSILFCLITESLMAQQSIFFHQIEMGPSFGQVKTWNDELETRVNFSFQTLNGVHINSKHALGILLGVDSYPGFVLAPIAFGWRGTWDIKGRNKFLYGMDLGYASAFLEKRVLDNFTERWFEGGLLVSPNIGWRWKSKKEKFDYSFSLAFRRQHAYFFEGSRGEGPNLPGLPPGFSAIREESYIFNSLISRFGIFF
ncbi:hypothetical protein [Mongoliibacter ruber]|uniref:Outer membrane protein with beta-barrel domain n=1 Tax=Mongoliibacter ruber TaxID=1750599 RepID=A0A2T0WIM6_9BACT|nr:hypothetical protein [Mongoliibacter ruber]PRY86546.1 hypothetical protein CLW00_10833 [Mongoliibacter ruber]